ncbi:type II secretion system F family protein [Streptomyces sp. 5.8]|uniref:type II secretion system F family protein n=1 Tax=Streptomyces sp. 5.8 TaxID=3406571 RepID=UPI003BB55F7C
MTPIALSLLIGAGIGLGVILLVRELFPSGPALGPAMERLHGTGSVPRSHQSEVEPPVLTRAGDAVADRVRHWPGITIPVKQLNLVGESVGELFGAKVLHFGVGLLLPSLFTLIVAMAGVQFPLILSGLVGLLAGSAMWFVPDARLAKRATRARAEATQAVMAYAELAAMERVSSAGAQDTLERPAEVGSGWVFQRIQGALLRARLDRAPAWEALRQISEELDVPAAADIADIVSSAGTDGAAIYSTLRSRAESLADEQASDDQARANAASESLVVPVTLLSMVLLVFFGFPAVARIFSV